METVKQYMERKNLDDANLAEILKYIIAEAGLSVGDLFDDQDIADHVHDGGMPMDEIFDEDEILACGCVIDAMDELEKKRSKTRKKNAELEEKVAELKAKVAELEKSWDSMRWELNEKETELMEAVDAVERVDKLKNTNAKLREANRTLGARNTELEKELAEFREWNAKMKDNGNEEWCRRCGSWQREGWNGIDVIRIVKDAKWGCVCEDCLHHLDNEDHERCGECDGCKDCGCDCEEEKTEE